MRDRLAEKLAFTFSLDRQEPAPGAQRPHVNPTSGPDAPAGVGLDRAGDGILRALGALVLDVREHVHASLPRAEDKDFSILKQKINGDKRSDPPMGRVTLDAAGGANDKTELHVQMAEGFVGHVTALLVRATSPAFDMANLRVTFTLRGTSLATSRVRFARPFVVEMGDEIVLTLQNLAATPTTAEYAVEGWLRRED